MNLLGTQLEPIVANRPDKPCVGDSRGVLQPTTIGPLTASALTARTQSNPGGTPGARAESSVLDARVAGIAGVPVIEADVLQTSANASCVNGQPVFTSTSRVVRLRIGGTVVAIPTGDTPFVINAGLAKVYGNELIVGPSRITRRALRISTLLGTSVVIAESTANVEGNPCSAVPPPPKPECSDGVDNADPEDMLADSKDPGCYTNGVYDPNDNDETDAAKPPQCSDGYDNDGDKYVDASDPDCHTDGNASNDKSYDPSDDDEFTKKA